jgi:uncharacterized protein (TIGR03000 family)
MLRKWFAVLGVPALATLAVLVAVETASARPWGWGGYYGSYGPMYYNYGYPGYYSYGYYYPRYYGWSAGPYYSSGYYTYSPGYYVYPSYSYVPQYAYSSASPSYRSFYPADMEGEEAREANTAMIGVKVPADAQVWIEGSKTTQTGTDRRFESPSLTPGKTYSYDIRARWMGDSGEVTRTKHVTFHAGDRVTVDFTREAR